MIFATAVGRQRLRKYFPFLAPVQVDALYAMMRRVVTPAQVCEFMEKADEYLDGHGVEHIRDGGWRTFWLDAGLIYVNRGDPYIVTLMYDTDTHRFVADSYGDYIDSSLTRRRRFQNL